MVMRIRFKSKAGFTFIELMAAVVIIGIVSAMAAPTFDRAIQRARFKGEAKLLISDLRVARSHAIAEKAPFGVYFDANAFTVTIFKDLDNLSSYSYEEASDSLVSVDSLDSDIVYLYASFPSAAVIYQPNGTASGSGDIYMMSDNSDVINLSQINVLASTGRSKLLYIHNY